MGDDDPEFDLTLDGVTPEEFAYLLAGIGSVGEQAIQFMRDEGVEAGPVQTLETVSDMTLDMMRQNPSLTRYTLLESEYKDMVIVSNIDDSPILEELGLEMVDGQIVDRFDEDEAVDIEVS